MPNLNAILIELKQERDRLNQAIAALETVINNGKSGKTSTGKRTLSVAARKRIADAQRKRWAAFKKQRKAA